LLSVTDAVLSMNGSPVWFWPDTISGMHLSIRVLRRFGGDERFLAELSCED
jgi:hypothetical protein